MTAALAFVLWILDQHFCVHLHGLSSGNPQFHAWWHILMGINGYLGPTFLSYQRECHLGKRKPRMRWAGGLVPYVDTTDSSR
jgi:dihydroceramidase